MCIHFAFVIDPAIHEARKAQRELFDLFAAHHFQRHVAGAIVVDAQVVEPEAVKAISAILRHRHPVKRPLEQVLRASLEVKGPASKLTIEVRLHRERNGLRRRTFTVLARLATLSGFALVALLADVSLLSTLTGRAVLAGLALRPRLAVPGRRDGLDRIL